MAEHASRQNTTFPSGDGEAHGYLATPAAGSGPGVIVIQEWWGLTDHIADVTDRLAAEGFVALAPDLFGGATAHDADEAGRLMTELPVDGAARDLGGAIDFLLGHEAVTSSKVGAVGFCMGGGFVLLLAAQEEQIRSESGAEVEFHYYPAGHAFHNDTNKLGTYDEASARQAWERAVSFLQTKLA